MDKNQYFAVTEAIAKIEDDAAKIDRINEILGINIREPNEAKAFKEKIIGNDTILISSSSSEVTVSFSGVEATEKSFALAFIKTLLSVIGARAIDKYLPEPKVTKKADGNKRDGNGSPAPHRPLPIKGSNY